ncbi:MAG: fumarylacetoacetate hydrolase family protein [Burkholderiales bacterium]|nr:fumarylacetoacetate hydrolase family protein [Burkholderiales bacterium]
MTFALATLRIDGVPVPVIEVDGRHVRLDALAPDLLAPRSDRGLMNLFDDWPGAERRLLEAAARVPTATRGVVMPVFFLKPPTTTLVGCGPVRFPVQSSKFDWEIELAVIFGRRMRRVSQAEALAGVAGYAVGIDLSARDWQMNPRHPWKFDLFTGKAFDDACPLGPKIVPARFVDTRDLRLTLTVNGETKQDASSSDMIWSVAEQASMLSEFVTIEPGDVLLTGTPAGVGMASGTYLEVGDRIEASITGLGTMRVVVVPDSPSSGTPKPG